MLLTHHLIILTVVKDRLMFSNKITFISISERYMSQAKGKTTTPILVHECCWELSWKLLLCFIPSVNGVAPILRYAPSVFTNNNSRTENNINNKCVPQRWGIWCQFKQMHRNADGRNCLHQTKTERFNV